MEYSIRKNLGSISWAEAIEMTRETVAAHHAQLTVPREGVAQSTLGYVEPSQAGDRTCETPFLSPMLLEALQRFAQSATTVEAARKLGLSETMVQGRRSRILKAHNTKSMFEAVQMAKAQQLL